MKKRSLVISLALILVLTSSSIMSSQSIMEEDPTKVMIRGDLVRRMVLKKEGSHAHIQAFVGDMLTRGLLRYVGE